MDFYSEDSQKKGRKSEWYDDITRTLDKCPFCDLKDKYILAEKDGMVLTMNLFPYIDGHLMVIPRRHFEKVGDATKEEWTATQYLLDLGIKVIQKGLGVADINILYREGSISGNSLKHHHIHILPITKDFMRYEKQSFTYEFQDISLSPLEMAERLRKVAEKLK